MDDIDRTTTSGTVRRSRRATRPADSTGPLVRSQAAGRHIEHAELRARGVLTIPQAIRAQLALAIGDEMIVTVEDGRIVLTPATVVPRDQAWFWTSEWQAKEAEADADLAAGRTTRFDSDEAMIAALRNRP